MDTGSSARVIPAAAALDNGVPGTDNSVFETIYDVPYVVVNRIKGKLKALVEVAPDDDALTLARIREAITAAQAKGETVHAMKVGKFGERILIIFTPEQVRG